MILFVPSRERGPAGEASLLLLAGGGVGDDDGAGGSAIFFLASSPRSHCFSAVRRAFSVLGPSPCPVDPQERMKIGGLCPLFSLLATCLRSPQCSGSLDTIDATLGAPMILADSVTVGRFGVETRAPDHSRSVVILSLDDLADQELCLGPSHAPPF